MFRVQHAHTKRKQMGGKHICSCTFYVCRCSCVFGSVCVTLRACVWVCVMATTPFQYATCAIPFVAASALSHCVVRPKAQFLDPKRTHQQGRHDQNTLSRVAVEQHHHVRLCAKVLLLRETPLSFADERHALLARLKVAEERLHTAHVAEDLASLLRRLLRRRVEAHYALLDDTHLSCQGRARQLRQRLEARLEALRHRLLQPVQVVERLEDLSSLFIYLLALTYRLSNLLTNQLTSYFISVCVRYLLTYLHTYIHTYIFRHSR